MPPVDFQSSEVDIDREEEESVIIVEDQERSSKARTERVERSPDVLSEEEKPAADDVCVIYNTNIPTTALDMHRIMIMMQRNGRDMKHCMMM